MGHFKSSLKRHPVEVQTFTFMPSICQICFVLPLRIYICILMVIRFLYFIVTGDLMDILALLNSSINFILYCSMSRQFRQTFILLFCPRRLGRCLLSHRSHRPRRHRQNHPRSNNENDSCQQQYKHQHHNHESHQQMPLQEDNCTLVNGLVANDNRSRSAYIDQWFQTTQVTNV